MKLNLVQTVFKEYIAEQVLICVKKSFSKLTCISYPKIIAEIHARRHNSLYNFVHIFIMNKFLILQLEQLPLTVTKLKAKSVTVGVWIDVPLDNILLLLSKHQGNGYLRLDKNY